MNVERFNFTDIFLPRTIQIPILQAYTCRNIFSKKIGDNTMDDNYHHLSLDRTLLQIEGTFFGQIFSYKIEFFNFYIFFIKMEDGGVQDTLNSNFIKIKFGEIPKLLILQEFISWENNVCNGIGYHKIKFYKDKIWQDTKGCNFIGNPWWSSKILP